MKRIPIVPIEDEEVLINKIVNEEDVWQYLHDVGTEVNKLKEKVCEIDKIQRQYRL